MASGGGTAGNIPYYPSYTAAELRVAVEAAHALGRLTTAHCRAKQSMLNAVEAGLDCIEYGEFLVPGEVMEYGGGVANSGVMQYDPRVTERLLEAGTFVSYTMQAGGYDSLVELREKRADDGLSFAEDARRDGLESYYDTKLEIFRRLLADGMLPRLVISSDAGPFDCEFGRMVYGLRLAVEGGMNTLQAIQAATRVAAQACTTHRDRRPSVKAAQVREGWILGHVNATFGQCADRGRHSARGDRNTGEPSVECRRGVPTEVVIEASR